MNNLLKSEFRKLLTTRSTYGVALFCMVPVLIFAFWAGGLQADELTRMNPAHLMEQSESAASALAIIIAIGSLLLFANEYRYNTILYTLTSSNSRMKVLVSKYIVGITYALVVGLFFMILAPLLAKAGLAIKGNDLAPQNFYYLETLRHGLFLIWGYASIALLLVALLKNQLAAIAALFLTQATIEPLLGLVLKGNSKYLPFQSLNSVMGAAGDNSLSSGKAALVFLAYMVVGWTIAAVMFVKRDAS